MVSESLITSQKASSATRLTSRSIMLPSIDRKAAHFADGRPRQVIT